MVEMVKQTKLEIQEPLSSQGTKPLDQDWPLSPLH